MLKFQKLVKTPVRAALIAGSAILAGASVSRASFVIGSTYDLSIIGVNSVGNENTYSNTYDQYLVGPLTPTFGTTQTFTGAGLGGQNVNVSSSETISGPYRTDTITISVLGGSPNFDPSGNTYGGHPISVMLFDLGDNIEATGGPVTQNGWNYIAPVDPSFISSSASVVSTAFGTSPIGSDLAFNGTDTANYGDAGVSITGASDLSPYGLNSFTFTITAVPEPATVGLVGTLSAVALLRRRRRAI